MFSRACEYAFQATLYIALHQEGTKKVGVKEIAKAQDMPLPFLSKILQLLVKGKVLQSTKGPSGGFSLNKNPNEISLIEIVAVIDGLDIFSQCGIGLKSCSDSAPCPIHPEFKEIKQRIKRLLTEKTLFNLSEGVKDGTFTLNGISSL